eukprot:TRINITY_DN932_c3_g1_i1.p1 TRINITY_DN932_c3_g1~~TRINITY_DN932_c3_g1_i1.p1  ORF type:complete len:284 (+),score=130.99 TRINITY_DN932_c3_g1_i1:61-912(+)
MFSNNNNNQQPFFSSRAPLEGLSVNQSEQLAQQNEKGFGGNLVYQIGFLQGLLGSMRQDQARQNKQLREKIMEWEGIVDYLNQKAEANAYPIFIHQVVEAMDAGVAAGNGPAAMSHFIQARDALVAYHGQKYNPVEHNVPPNVIAILTTNNRHELLARRDDPYNALLAISHAHIGQLHAAAGNTADADTAYQLAITLIAEEEGGHHTAVTLLERKLSSSRPKTPIHHPTAYPRAHFEEGSMTPPARRASEEFKRNVGAKTPMTKSPQPWYAGLQWDDAESKQK